MILSDFACLHVEHSVFTKISAWSLTYQKIVHLFLHDDLKEQCTSVDSHQLHPMTTSSKEINNSWILTSKTSFKHHEFHPLNLETFLVCWCISQEIPGICHKIPSKQKGLHDLYSKFKSKLYYHFIQSASPATWSGAVVNNGRYWKFLSMFTNIFGCYGLWIHQ